MGELMHRGWFLPALLAFSVSGCVGGTRLAGAAPVLDVEAVQTDRVALRGREILVEGFISLENGDFFLLQGQRRAPDELGEYGEKFWCLYMEAPKLMWLRGKTLSRDFRRIRPHGDLGGHSWRGRKVIVRGLLKDRNLPDDPDEAIGLDADMRAGTIGPLENARIVQVFADFCGATNVR